MWSTRIFSDRGGQFFITVKEFGRERGKSVVSYKKDPGIVHRKECFVCVTVLGGRCRKSILYGYGDGENVRCVR